MRLSVLLLCLVFSLPAFAEMPVGKSDKPVEIEASGTLEWLRDKNMYRADKDVVITQGTTIIKGDQAEAFYDPKEGPSSLNLIKISGHVTIVDQGRTIIADTATYNVTTEKLELRGSNISITAPEINVTAQSGIDYFAGERKAVATGKAVATQNNQTLKAETITAWFNKDNKLERASANGNMLITQKTDKGTDIAQANAGEYNILTQEAVLRGNVRLTQGENHMQGDTATINLKTGVSTLANNPQNGGRVRAIFTPGGTSPMPSVTASVPMIPAKKSPEMPYQTDGRRL